MKARKLDNNITIRDNASQHYLGIMRVSVDSHAWYERDLLALPKTQFDLTREGAELLVKQLTSALAVIDDLGTTQDFTIHHDGAIWVDLDDSTLKYANLDDFINGETEAE